MKLKKNFVLKMNIMAFVKGFTLIMSFLCYFFQFPLPFLSSLIVPFLVFYIIMNFFSIKLDCEPLLLLLITVFFIFLGIGIFKSGIKEVEFSRIIRFLEILSMLVICLFIKDFHFQKTYNFIILLAVLKSLVLVCIGIYLIKLGSHINIRNWVESKSMGDIYLQHGIPKVQVQGNGLIPALFMIDFTKRKKLTFVNSILFLGSVFAGNFAFILGIFLFAIIRIVQYIKKYDRYGLIILFCMLIGLTMLPYTYNYLEYKTLQKSHSNSLKVEQMIILADTNLIIGNGLGSYIQKQGKYRTYNGNIYYEIQSFYILNQIGIIAFVLFLIISCFKIYKNDKTALYLYLLYLFYSFFNPYSFDTTHMFVIIILENLYRNKMSNYLG